LISVLRALGINGINGSAVEGTVIVATKWKIASTYTRETKNPPSLAG
jgi:hypothetical protein